MNQRTAPFCIAVDALYMLQAERFTLASSSSSHPIEFSAAPTATLNPSIERTCPGKPGQAAHLKR